MSISSQYNFTNCRNSQFYEIIKTLNHMPNIHLAKEKYIMAEQLHNTILLSFAYSQL